MILVEPKRILITCATLEIGGIERSLLSLLRALDPARVRVDLLLFAHSGPLLTELPPWVRLLPEAPALATFLRPVKQTMPRHPLLALARLRAKRHVRRAFPCPPCTADGAAFALLQAYWDGALPLLPRIKTKYDTVLSYQWPHHYAAFKVRAEKKFAWVHTDFRQAALSRKKDADVWRQFDGVACVSQGVLEGFAEVHASCAQKCFVFENLLHPGELQEKARAFVPTDMPRRGAVLLSVGRYCYAKGFDNAILICAHLLAMGLEVTWYLIGYGSMEAELRAQIARHCLERHFIIIGKRENPYPYMAACDVYVQPSRYEGRAVAVMEALALGKPVAVTDFPTARAQVTDGVDAKILPMEPRAAAETLAALLQNPGELARFSRAAAARDVSGFAQLEGLYTQLGA
ncbi:MAG: glycosyltransferase [Oscillospiraceae bacterium]|jgi:glycosyltransferase involved in cell wall biosynthesis|nr:glycosyltransferase [Oscillospiraceae bacterium]